MGDNKIMKKGEMVVEILKLNNELKMQKAITNTISVHNVILYNALEILCEETKSDMASYIEKAKEKIKEKEEKKNESK